MWCVIDIYRRCSSCVWSIACKTSASFLVPSTVLFLPFVFAKESPSKVICFIDISFSIMNIPTVQSWKKVLSFCVSKSDFCWLLWCGCFRKVLDMISRLSKLVQPPLKSSSALCRAVVQRRSMASGTSDPVPPVLKWSILSVFTVSGIWYYFALNNLEDKIHEKYGKVGDHH